jgi:mRNA-degrading endonuclease RelE of RelBE toxin-antitoxin system
VLTFVETPTFTRLITDLVSDDDYAAFQRQLADNPTRGGPLAGCGGVRKARLALPGRGKSGGARVIYLYLQHRETIYLIYVFTKGDAANLSAAGKQAVREIAQQIKAEDYHA